MKYFIGAIIAAIVIGSGYFFWSKYKPETKVEPVKNTAAPKVEETPVENSMIGQINPKAVAALNAFPTQAGDLERTVIYLPVKEDEWNYLLELRVGRTIKSDCNLDSISGNFTKKTVSGWGYEYWEVGLSGITSTLMHCMDNVKKYKFVYDTKLVVYSSRTPVVVFVPKGAEVRYIIWTIDSEEFRAESK